MNLLSSLPAAFGLHLTDRSAKLVLLEQSRFFGRPTLPRVRTMASKELPPGLVINGEIKNMESLRVELRALLASSGIKKNYGMGVVANLPEGKTFLKYVPAQEKSLEEINKMVQKTVAAEIPFSKEELVLDTQVFKENSGNNTAILIGAAPKAIVDSYVTLLEGLGLTLYALEIESVAIARAVLNNSSAGEIEKTEMIIDIGGERTGVIFATGGIPRLTVLVPFSGNQLTKHIADRLKISLSEAEQAKIKCGLDVKKCEGSLRNLLGSIVDDLTSKLRNAVKYYHSEFKDASQVAAIYLSGGGSYLLKLDSVVSQELRIKARRADLAASFKTPKKLGAADLLHYTTALGLALRGLNYIFENHEK